MKRIYTPEQIQQHRIKKAEWLANRSPEKVEKDKAKHNIANAKWMAKRSPEKIAEDKAKHKIVQARCLANRTPERVEEYKEYSLKHDLGYYAVYLIENYNSLGDHYCGQTGNLYNRMAHHKHLGRMNTDIHRVLQCFETREQALAFEAIQHEAGYHGDCRTEINK